MSYSQFNKYVGNKMPGVPGLRFSTARNEQKAAPPAVRRHGGAAAHPAALAPAAALAGNTVENSNNSGLSGASGSKERSRFCMEQENLN